MRRALTSSSRYFETTRRPPSTPIMAPCSVGASEQRPHLGLDWSGGGGAGCAATSRAAATIARVRAISESVISTGTWSRLWREHAESEVAELAEQQRSLDR